MKLKTFLSTILILLFLSGQGFAEGSKFDRFATDAEATVQTRDDVGLTPANIPSIMGAPGVISKFQLDHNVELLNADRTILITDKPIQWYDPNGVDRNVTLSAEASSTDLVFTIYNDSDGAGEDLVIRDDTPTTLITIGPGQGARVSCDGTSWKFFNNKGVYYDVVNDRVGIGTSSPLAKLHFYNGASGGVAHAYSKFILEDDSFVAMQLLGPSTTTQYIFFGSEVSNVMGGISYNHSTNTMIFSTNWGVPRITIDGLGKVGIGTSSPDTLLELQKESADAEETISVYHDTEATAAIITLRKADNNATTPALVDDNAVLGRINFKGHDGSGWHTGAKIEARVDGTPSDGTDMPTELVFSTTADGAGSPTDHLRIAPNGDVETLHREILKPTTFEFTTEADITDPLPTSVILLSGDNDSENDAIDLQNGETAGQILYLIASANIDADDTCTINYGDTTCTNCPATVFNKVGENAHLIWTGSTWVVISLQNAL